MKVLAIGSVPPPVGGHRSSLLAEVLQRRQAGDEVEIVSVDTLAAAHRYLSAPGLPAVLEIATLVRDADVVLLQIEPGLPVRQGASRAERSAALMALSAVLRKSGEVVLRLDHGNDLPGGPGGRAGAELWKAASRVEVGDESVAAELVSVMPALASRISVAGRPVGPGLRSGAEALENWGTGADATAERVIEVVRRRAAVDRVDLGERGRLPIPGGGRGTRVAQWQWLPSPGAGVPDLGPMGEGALAGLARRSDGSMMRRAARSALVAADRRAVTRPAADLARWARAEAGSLRNR